MYVCARAHVCVYACVHACVHPCLIHSLLPPADAIKPRATTPPPKKNTYKETKTKKTYLHLLMRIKPRGEKERLRKRTHSVTGSIRITAILGFRVLIGVSPLPPPPHPKLFRQPTRLGRYPQWGEDLCACVCVRACVCACACVRACVWGGRGVGGGAGRRREGERIRGLDKGKGGGTR